MYLRDNTLLQGGKYKITRYISHGGFGCTYEAVNTTMRNRRVAIKELFVSDFCNRDTLTGCITVTTQSKIPLFDKLRNKFLDEAETIMDLNHPGIVRVTDFFEENGTAYYVMDYIDGYSLRDLVKRVGALSEQTALLYIRQVADALQYVHGKSRLHLDIKPANIMVNNEGKAILIDFGVSKQYDEVSGENTSSLLGHSPGYAPPEQANNKIGKFLPATDIYALGATLYNLLTGIVPPTSSELAAGEELPPMPSTITPATHRAIEESVILNKLARPQSIAEFLAILEGGSAHSDETHIEEEEQPREKRKHPVEEDKKHREEERIYHEYETDPERSPLRWLWIALVGIVIGVGVVVGMRGCQSHAGGEPDAADSTTLVDTTINTDDGSDAPPVRETADDAEQTRLAEENRRLREKIRKDSIEAAKKAEAERIAKEVRQAQNENISETQDEGWDAPSVSKTTYDSDSERWQNLIPVVYVSGGTFTMGATSEQGSNANSDEKPTHQVTVSSFYMGKYEVTQAQWEAVMGSNPSKYKGSNLPVDNVSYEDAVAFCRKLSSLTGRTYRLPTEAEWEYAARGGNQSRGYKYSGSNDQSSVAWYVGNSGRTPHAVGTKRANELGLYDMSGNVWEWCSDWYDYYSYSPQTNPQGASSGDLRVARGGTWNRDASRCRVSFRSHGGPSDRSSILGFRVVLEP